MKVILISGLSLLAKARDFLLTKPCKPSASP
jgi:hypothetical protein